MPVPHFDLAVIGSGPAGQKGAIAAAKMRKRVAVVDRLEMVGGCSLHLGTIPSKTMREAILYLSGIRQRTFYGADYRAKENISAHDLSQRVDVVLQREIDHHLKNIQSLQKQVDDAQKELNDNTEMPYSLPGTTSGRRGALLKLIDDANVMIQQSKDAIEQAEEKARREGIRVNRP